MKLKAIYNAVICKPYEMEKSTNSNIITADLGEEKNKIAEIVAVGPGQFSINGDLIPTQLQIGQIIILPTMGFSRFVYDGEEYFIGKENEVLGIIEN